MNIREITKTLQNAFSNQYKKVKENIALMVAAVLKCNRVNTATIARQMSFMNGLSFDANDKKIRRFLQSKRFQVDDKMWRRYIKLLFQLIKNNQPYQAEWTINVDYTSDKNKFSILVASIVIGKESIPIYFSMRKYATRSGTHDQKKV